MKIQSATITNFQSHKDTYIEFSEGLNIILGDTDTGKSALLRALSFVIRNAPFHTSFITTGEDTTNVELRLCAKDNIIKLSRIRSRDRRLNDLWINEEELTNIGRVVPDSVYEKLGIRREVLDIFYGGQFDNHFLLKGVTPAQRAKSLFIFGDISKVDNAIKSGKSSVLSFSRIKKDYEEQLNAIESELQTFPDIDKLRKDLNKVMKLQEFIEIGYQLLEAKKEYSAKITKNREHIKELNMLLDKDVAKDIEKLLLLKTIFSLEKTILSNNGKRICLEDYSIQIEELIAQLRELLDKICIIKRIKNAVVFKTTAKTKFNKSNTELNYIESEITKILKSLGFCPMCERKMS